MDLDNALETIKKAFSPRKKIDFDKEGLHFEIEPLTSKEEILILESLKDLDGSEYIGTLKRYSLACSIKKINDLDLSGEDVEYVENEEVKTKSKFLYMRDYLSKWPSSLVDLIFDAFTDMNQGNEKLIRDNAIFEKFNVSEEPEEEAPEKLQPVEETDAGLTETEKLNKKVKEELERETERMVQTENKAVQEDEKG